MVALPRVGRILTDTERISRMADESAALIPNESLRSAFAISSRHVLTAWHCVHEDSREGNALWFRIHALGRGAHYLYLPVRVSNHDELFDVAALAVDDDRLDVADLTLAEAEQHLAEAAVPLASSVSRDETVVLLGFPASGTAADSDTNDGKVVDTDLPLGEVVAMKIQGNAFGAASPVDPHGLSGGPVLSGGLAGADSEFNAVGVVRAAPRGLAPHMASGGSVVASRISDLVGLIPEVAVALTRSTAQELATAVALSSGNTNDSQRLARLTPSGSFLKLSRECQSALAATVIDVVDPGRGALYGWAHFFDEPHDEHLRPTAISTAYGLKIAQTIDAPDGSVDRSRLVETLWKLKLPDGGWAARTGREHSRMETTALVLGALATAGADSTRLAEAGAAFDKALTRQADSVARSLVYPTCAAIRGLVRARRGSPRLAELRTSLLDGAITDPTNLDLWCWASELASSSRSAKLVPSVVHTAMSIVALSRAAMVLENDEETASVLQGAITWLSQHPDMSNKSEQIRRVVAEDDEHRDMLNIDHFTAAWVARALLSAQPLIAPEGEALLLNAVRTVWLSQHEGVWTSDEGKRPVWMTYQGLAVLREYSMLRGLEVLPTEAQGAAIVP
jgi:Trypsin-like peptidase domain